jgi:hypothetical protein
VSERVNALADLFEQKSGDFLALVSALPADSWSRPFGNGDDRSTRVVAHHVAAGYEATLGAALALISGAELNLTMEMIHDGNAAHAAQFADVSREATLTLLRDNGASTVKALKSLTDAQLDSMVTFYFFGDAPVSGEALIKGLVFGHIDSHKDGF